MRSSTRNRLALSAAFLMGSLFVFGGATCFNKRALKKPCTETELSAGTCLYSTTKLPEEKPAKFPHEIWNNVVTKYVNDTGKVNYDAVSKDRADLDLYVAYVNAYGPVKNPEMFPTQQDKLAYYINAYNASVFMNVIAKFDDVKKYKNIYKIVKPFFFDTLFIYGGEKNNLYNLENNIVRPMNDPRIHFALNCASESCPRLPNFAFTAEKLEEQLEAEALEFCNDPRNVKLEGNVLKLSEIFDFYGGKDAKPDSDFVVYEKSKGNTPSDRNDAIVDYINRYATTKLPDASTLKIEFIPYNWTPNDQTLNP